MNALSSNKPLKMMLNIVALTLLLFAASSQCFALVELADVSKERAKELGVTIRSQRSGDTGIAVWLEFKPQGALKNFTHVKVEITANGKTMISAPLQESHPTTDTVSVYFSGDSAYLADGVLTIMVKNGERTLIGYQFKVKDFIESENSR